MRMRGLDIDNAVVRKVSVSVIARVIDPAVTSDSSRG